MPGLHPRSYTLLRALVLEPESLPRNRFFSLFEDPHARALKGRAALIRKLHDTLIDASQLVIRALNDEEFELHLAGDLALQWATTVSRAELELLLELSKREAKLSATRREQLELALHGRE